MKKNATLLAHIQQPFNKFTEIRVLSSVPFQKEKKIKGKQTKDILGD